MSKYIDDIAIDRSASYNRKYILGQIRHVWKRIFHRYYDKKLQKAIEEYGQIHLRRKTDNNY